MVNDDSRTLVWFVVLDNETQKYESIHIFSSKIINTDTELRDFINNFCSNRNLTLLDKIPITRTIWQPRILRSQSRLPPGEFDCLSCNQECLLQGIWFENSPLPDEFQFCSSHCRRHNSN